MFENSSVMILKAGHTNDEIFRLELDASSQHTICESFSKAQEELVSQKTPIVFDGSYKPNNDEFLTINNFQLSNEIKDAVRDPLGVPSFQKVDGDFPEIKAILVGEYIQTGEFEEFHIAFQRFRKDQYITNKKGINLFFNDSTFIEERRFGINISDDIDCYYTNMELQFTSFHYARQIFNLNNYYRSATDQEVEHFSQNSKLAFESPENFKGMANTWIRRKIAMINDSKVLENFSVAEIKRCANNIEIQIEVEEGKIRIPDNKEQVKIILGFLDEEAYKGPFSKNTFLANSKRQIH